MSDSSAQEAWNEQFTVPLTALTLKRPIPNAPALESYLDKSFADTAFNTAEGHCKGGHSIKAKAGNSSISLFTTEPMESFYDRPGDVEGVAKERLLQFLHEYTMENNLTLSDHIGAKEQMEIIGYTVKRSLMPMFGAEKAGTIVEQLKELLEKNNLLEDSRSR